MHLNAFSPLSRVLYLCLFAAAVVASCSRPKASPAVRFPQELEVLQDVEVLDTEASKAAFAGHAIQATSMIEELKTIGLDVHNLPRFQELEGEQLRTIMGTFTRALGAQCADCHNREDFAASHARKQIAKQMWNQFVRGLTLQDGTPLYCDSCHQGQIQFLDRRNPEALSAWMEENLVHRLKRKDEKEYGCQSCHGEPFEGEFLQRWANGEGFKKEKQIPKEVH